MLLHEIVVNPLGAWDKQELQTASQAQDWTALFAGADRCDFATGLVCTPQPSLCQAGVHTLPYAELTVAKVSPWVTVSFPSPALMDGEGARGTGPGEQESYASGVSVRTTRQSWELCLGLV